MEVHMSDETPSASGALSLPDHPNLDWLRKQAKRRLDELRVANPSAKLSDAQFDLARQYGFASWRALKAHIDGLTMDGRLFEAARSGEMATLVELLDANPAKLYVRDKPYEWTLLHAAAHNGRLGAVNLLLERGLDVNAREKGDNTYPMHWAAAAGHVDVVRRLADAGGDVVGKGDVHELEVIGWATCWDGANDAAHRAVVDVLIAHGARHHIFSAVAMGLADEVRRIVAADATALSRRLSRNENHQTPLLFAVATNRPEMVALLVELGADPLATDGDGYGAIMYATSPGVDRPMLEAVRKLTAAELTSAARGSRRVHGNVTDLIASLSLGELPVADRLVRDNPGLLLTGGALHLLAKRGDVRAVRWLLDHGADPNARWAHWDADVTPLHLAAWQGHVEVVETLLGAGADPTIRDSKHDGDALGWAEHGGRADVARMLKSRVSRGQSP
jgi:ankyrin repeat protein